MKIRWAVPLLVLGFGSTGCFDIHCHWKDEVCEPAVEGEGRQISGAVLNLAKAIPVFARNEACAMNPGCFTQAALRAEAKVSGVRVCVVDADPEICSDPSGADDGSYSLSVPVDGEFEGKHVNLYAEIDGMPDVVNAREFAMFLEPPNASRPETNRNVYVVPTAVIGALAVQSGLATAGDPMAHEKALEKGAGVILSYELAATGDNFAMPRMIDVSAHGAVANLYGIQYDSAQPGGVALMDVESTGEKAPYPLAAAVYVADGTTGEITVELCDRASMQGPALDWTVPTFANGPGLTIVPRPVITNTLARFHEPEIPECVNN